MSRRRKPIPGREIYAWVCKTLAKQLREWSTLSNYPVSRLIRRLLVLVPWWRMDACELVVLVIPKEVLADKREFRKWMTSARRDIEREYLED